MMNTNTLNADVVIANVEAFLAAQYAKRKVEKPADGVIGVWFEIVRIALIWIGK